MITFRNVKPEPVRRELADPSFGSLVLIARRPTYDDFLLEAVTRGVESANARFAIVEQWEGVVGEDGNPVPFNQQNFRTLLGAFPVLIGKAGGFVNELFNEVSIASDDAKKSESPPPAG